MSVERRWALIALVATVSMMAVRGLTCQARPVVSER